MNLENQLRAALVREEPSPDFTARVLALTARKPRTWRREWLAVAAALLIGTAIPAGLHEYNVRKEAEGRQAKQQLMTAMRITSHRIRRTQYQLRRFRELELRNQ